MGTEQNVKILFVDVSSILVLATIIFFTFVPEILIECGMIFFKNMGSLATATLFLRVL